MMIDLPAPKKGEPLDPMDYDFVCPDGVSECNMCGAWFFPDSFEDFCTVCIAAGDATPLDALKGTARH